MRLVSKTVTWLPEFVRRPLRGTPLETIYHHLAKYDVDLAELRAGTPVGPVRLLAPEQSIITRIVRDRGRYEPVLTRAICDSFDEVTVFYDVGSRYGYYAALALAAGVPGPRVHCFEAEIRAHHVLERNCGDDGIVANRTRVGSGDDDTAIDEYVEDNPPPTVVKVDVEGAEHAVVEGMTSCLDRYGPELFVEMHPHLLPEFEATPGDVFARLRAAGYSLRVEPDHRSERAGWAPVAEAELPDDSTYLLHAVPGE